jgi:amidophosphoribosyltransferase
MEGSNQEQMDEYLDPLSKKYRLMVDWIAHELNVTTLRYLTLDDIVTAIGMPREQLCLYCWNGKYPDTTFMEDEQKQFRIDFK